MSEEKRSTTDQILDLLLDALAERQAKRQPPEPTEQLENEAGSMPEPPAEPEPVQEVEELVAETAVVPERNATPHPWDVMYPLEGQEEEEEEIVPELIPEKLPSINLEKMLFQLSLAVFVLIIIINIPFNRFGTNLARAMPDEQAMVVRDGLVIKGSGEEIYVLEDNKKRWISSLDAFEYFGYQWSQVNVVEDEFLARFEDGRPIHVLLKCNRSPHVYALEDGEKRWINTLATFQAEGYVWEDVKMVSCAQLRQIPDGTPIPTDAGDPPPPLP